MTFNPGTPSATTSTLAASPGSVTADGVSTTTLTVTVEDAQGNLVPNAAVTLSGSGTANSFGTISGTTNANGVFTTTLASTLAQTETITATEGSVHESTSVTFNPGTPSATTSTLAASPGSVTADGVSTTTLTVTVEDAQGNLVPNAAVTLSGSGTANSFGTVSGTTNANGVFTTTLASTLAQTETITATEGGVQETTLVTFHNKVIELFGSTSLVQSATNFYLDAISSGSGPTLKLGGVSVVPGQSTWAPIGAEQTAGGGYEVALKDLASGDYTVWNTDASGNVVSDTIGHVTGTSAALEALEPSFQQDLNGDGVIGIPTTVIELFGSTSLVQSATNFYLDAISSGSGPTLKLGGVSVVPGQSTWAPIGAEQTAGGGYEVALKDSASGDYTVWNTDASGNVVSDTIGHVTGTSAALEALEPSFQQDLNGDGVIGIPTTVIELFGSTSLVQSATNFYLDAISGGSGPTLKLGGVSVVPGQSTWAPIGAEQTAGGGYEVALKDSASGDYTVWNTDASGNVVSDTIGHVTGTSAALEALEPSFQQDLNGDGVIGIPTTVIELFGSTSLVQSATNFYLDAISGGSGPTLKLGGVSVVPGQSTWAPIGAEQTAGGGYEVALKDLASGDYTVWNTDASGNVVSDTIGHVTGTSAALEALEPSFQQDLNGDGVIGQSTIAIGQTTEILSAFAGAITFAGSTGTLQLDSSSSFTGTVAGLAGLDTLDLRDVNPATVQSPTYSGSASGGTLTVTDGSHIAKIELLGNYLASTFVTSSDGHGGTAIVDPLLTSSNQQTDLTRPQHV